MNIELWLTLLGASILISLSPGAGAATAISSGLQYGFKGATSAVVGLIAGYGTQLLVVALGVGTLVAASTVAFNTIKYLGALYLIWLGITTIKSTSGLQLHEVEPLKQRQRFLRAYFVNIMNPKGMVFLLALVPQFLDLNQPQLPQLFIIAATLVGIDWIVMTGYSSLASSVRQWIINPRGRTWLNRLSGSALIIAGLVLSTATL